MGGVRRFLRRLNAVRALAACALLVATLVGGQLLGLLGPAAPLYGLTAALFAAVAIYALIDRKYGDSPLSGVAQVWGDLALALGFVAATGGVESPLTFAMALPVMLAAGLFGLRAGLFAGIGIWLPYAAMLVRAAWGTPGQLAAGAATYLAVSHLVGFLAVGIFGGVLADRLRSAGRELEERRGDLASLRAMHRRIVESISTGLLTTDLSGRVTFVNRAGREILGGGSPLRGEAPVGSDATVLFGLRETLLDEVAAQLQSGQRYRFERPWTRPADEEDLYLGFTVTTLGEHRGQPIGWLFVFQDLTEIASLEEQVRTRERMAALGELAASMAHELRNPLAAISGCVQLLHSQSETGERRDAELDKVVLDESRRLDRIIGDFLEFARPTPFEPRPCDLAALMHELARMLEKSPDFAEGHAVTVEAPREVAGLADPDRMRQVFWNLASNALKSMPDGGALSIRVRPHAGDQAIVEFADEGHGMDAETAKRYFQPFQSQFRKGTGLGAAIVYRIVQEHGGDVQLVSREGKGTTVRLILPAAESAPVEAPRDEASPIHAATPALAGKA